MVGQKDPNKYDSGLIGDPINHKCMPGGGGVNLHDDQHHSPWSSKHLISSDILVCYMLDIEHNQNMHSHCQQWG